MKNIEETLEIRRLLRLENDQVDGFNKLLDDGVSWDENEGDKFLKDDNNALFVAYLGDIPVGFLTAHRLQRFDERRAEVLIYEVGVDSEYQRMGIGTALLSNVKKWSKKVEADEMWVLTNKSNLAAMEFYESLGGMTESGDEQMFVFKV